MVLLDHDSVDRHRRSVSPPSSRPRPRICSGWESADDIQLYADSIAINKSASTSAISLSVAGPNDYYFRSPAGSSRAAFSLLDMNIASDGLYNFEVKQYTYRGERTVNDPASGRGRSTQKIVDVKTSSGHFRVKNGAIVIADKSVKEGGA